MNPEFDEFKKVCERGGLRVTHQRLEIFRELASDPGHPSAEEIYRRVRRRLPTISLDTVYRTISTFERCGVVNRLQVLDDRIRYDTNLEAHHHMVCTRCKRVDDFYWPRFDSLEQPPTAQSWGQVESKHVEFRGLCNECRKKAGES